MARLLGPNSGHWALWRGITVLSVYEIAFFVVRIILRHRSNDRRWSIYMLFLTKLQLLDREWSSLRSTFQKISKLVLRPCFPFQFDPSLLWEACLRRSYLEWASAEKWNKHHWSFRLISGIFGGEASHHWSFFLFHFSSKSKRLTIVKEGSHKTLKSIAVKTLLKVLILKYMYISDVYVNCMHDVYA